MAKAKAKTKKPVAPKQVEAPKPRLVQIQINAKFLRALRHVAAQNDIRYYLNGVHFSTTKEGGKFYVATDGHRIAVLQEPWGAAEEPQDVSIIIPREVAAKASPILTDASWALLKQQDAWTWTMQGKGEVHQTFKAIDGKFPDWQRVMPAAVSGERGSYNWRYIYDFDQVVREAFGYRYSVELQQNAESAAVVTCGTFSFLGLVMPVRISGSSMPQWALAAQKESAKLKEKEKREQAAREREAVAA